MKLTPKEIAKLKEINKTSMESYILKPNGERIPVTPKNGTDFHWTELVEHLKDEKNKDPIFRIVRIIDDRVMLVEDNGYALELEYNQKATYLYSKSGGRDVIVGQVLVCPDSMVK